MPYHLACPLTGHGLCSCSAGAPPSAATPGGAAAYDAMAASLYTVWQATAKDVIKREGGGGGGGGGGGPPPPSASPDWTTVPVPPLSIKAAPPPGPAAAAAAARAVEAEGKARAAAAAAAAAAQVAAALEAHHRPHVPGSRSGRRKHAAAPVGAAAAAATAAADTSLTLMVPEEAAGAAANGARLKVQWTDGEWWDASVVRLAGAPPPYPRSVTLLYDEGGEEEDGVDLVDMAAKGEVAWTAAEKEAARRVAAAGGVFPHEAAAAAAPPHPPASSAAAAAAAAAPAAMASATRIPLPALVALGPQLAGARLRVSLANGAQLTVTAGAPVPGQTGLPVTLPNGDAVNLLADRDGLDFSVCLDGV